MEDISLSTIIISIVCSLIASWIFLKLLKFREYRLKKKIADLDFEIEFLDRIDKGYKELIRVSIKVICFALGLCASAAAFLVASHTLEVLSTFKSTISILSLACLVSAAGMLFAHFRSIAQLTDKESVQKKMIEKKSNLERKLSAAEK